MKAYLTYKLVKYTKMITGVRVHPVVLAPNG